MADIGAAKSALQRRSSPRTNKGMNPHLEQNMELPKKIPRKINVGMKNPPTMVNDSTTTPADSTETPDDSLAMSSDSSGNSADSSPNGNVISAVASRKPPSAEQIKKKVAELKVQWEKDGKNKKKEVLLKELVDCKESEFITNQNYMIATRNKDRIVKKAKELQSNNEELNGKNEELQDACENLQEQLEKSQDENVVLQKKLAAAIKSKAALRMKGRKKLADDNEALLNHIVEKSKTVLWGLVKFIQSPEEELDAARFLVKFGDLPKEYCASKEMKMEIAEMYSDKIKRAIFSKRNYTTAEEKKFYRKMWKAGRSTLTVQDLMMCLQRKIVTDDDMDKFMAYWEDYLPKQVGASEWDRNTRYYTTISKAWRNDCKSHSMHLVTPEDEAFLVLSIENGVQRWKEEFDNPKPPKVVAEDGSEVAEDGAAVAETNNHNGLYTSTTTGQNQYGGWSEKGLHLFKQYVEMNIEAQNHPNTAELEKTCLTKLRIKWGIQCDTAEEHNKQRARMKSARKRGRVEEPMPPMKKVIRTMRMMQESSDEEYEEEED